MPFNPSNPVIGAVIMSLITSTGFASETVTTIGLYIPVPRKKYNNIPEYKTKTVKKRNTIFPSMFGEWLVTLECELKVYFKSPLINGGTSDKAMIKHN